MSFTAKTGRTFSSFLSHKSEFIILSYTTIHINCFLSLYSLKSRAGETFFYYYYSAKTTIKRVAVKRSVQRETVLFNTKRERERKERELKESLKIAQRALTDCANYLSIEIQIFLAERRIINARKNFKRE